MAKKKANTAINKGATPAPEVETNVDVNVDPVTTTEELVQDDDAAAEAAPVTEANTVETKVEEAPKGKSKKTAYTVAIAFKDAKQYRKDGKINEYTVGADVSDLDPDRLENLVKRGIVDKS